MGIKKSARLLEKTNSWKKCIQIIIHAWLFLGVRLCKLNILHNPSSTQHYDTPHYSVRCNIESNILLECIALILSFENMIDVWEV